MWVRVALSLPAPSSSSADTSTVCAVLQVEVPKVRLVLSTVRSVPVVPPTATVTWAVGCEVNATVYVLLAPSVTVSVAGLSARPRSSSSVIVSVAPVTVTPATCVVPLTAAVSSASSTSSETGSSVNVALAPATPAAIVRPNAGSAA